MFNSSVIGLIIFCIIIFIFLVLLFRREPGSVSKEEVEKIEEGDAGGEKVRTRAIDLVLNPKYAAHESNIYNTDRN